MHSARRRRSALSPHAAMIALAFAYNARPAADLPPMGTKPFTPSAFRAALHASAQTLMVRAYTFFPFADIFFETTLPRLLFTRLALVKPLFVFSLLPANTEAFARTPLASMLTLFAFFMAFFMAFFITPPTFFAFFMAFIAELFMAAFFMAPAFIAAAFFMALPMTWTLCRSSGWGGRLFGPC